MGCACSKDTTADPKSRPKPAEKAAVALTPVDNKDSLAKLLEFARTGNEASVRDSFITSKFDINLTSDDLSNGDSALHSASEFGHLSVVKLLLGGTRTTSNDIINL